MQTYRSSEVSRRITDANGFSIWNSELKTTIAGKLNAIGAGLLTTVAATLFAVGAASAATVSEKPLPKHDDEETHLLQVIARHVKLQPISAEQHFIVRCPVSYFPTRYSITAAHDRDDFFVQTGAQLIAVSNYPVAVDNGTLAHPLLNGAGYDITLQSVDAARQSEWNLEIVLTCLAHAATTDFKLRVVKSVSMAAPGSYSTEVLYCPTDFPVALAGFRTGDTVSLKDSASAPAWGNAAQPMLLQDLDDGRMGPPTSWESRVFNRSGVPVEFVAHALCGKAPGVKSYIYSTPTVPGETFSIFAPVSEPAHYVGAGATSGADGIDKGFDAWLGDGTVVNFLAWYARTTDYNSARTAVRAYIAQGVNAGQTAGRAVAAVLAIPEQDGARPIYTVNVTEFYNASLDHYFITADSREISDLERGVHPGWTRTGQSFKAYGFGSGGLTGCRPVCRAYGKPEAGLNSHFYSANTEECFDTLAYHQGAWVLESSEVFQMIQPNPITGACAAGGVPVYRTWNKRADSNHRYTTSMPTRDEMIAKGHVAEGYGPTSVTLCALF